jgi:hypothetical protein
MLVSFETFGTSLKIDQLSGVAISGGSLIGKGAGSQRWGAGATERDDEGCSTKP